MESKTIKITIGEEDAARLELVQSKLGDCSQPAAIRAALRDMADRLQRQSVTHDQTITTAYELQTQA